SQCMNYVGRSMSFRFDQQRQIGELFQQQQQEEHKSGKAVINARKLEWEMDRIREQQLRLVLESLQGKNEGCVGRLLCVIFTHSSTVCVCDTSLHLTLILSHTIA